MSKLCCIECFAIPEIKEFIKSKERTGDCDYCKSKNIHILEAKEVGQFIFEGIKRFYEDAANEVSYCSKEGGYLLSTSDIHEILIDEEVIFSEVLDVPSCLAKDLISNDGTPFVKKDPYGPPPGQPEEIRNWENFCNIVKREKRFTVFLPDKEEDYFDQPKPKNVLYDIIKRFFPSLITILPKGSKVFRARIKNDIKDFLHEDLTSPPLNSAQNSRMSPNGISFLYGTLEPDTCIHEIRPNICEEIVVGEFEVVRDLLILDFTLKIEEKKSIFDPEYNFSYEEYYKPFLKHFIKEISKPIRQSDGAIEYVPTQIFTEVIKSYNFRDYYVYNDLDGKDNVYLNGIKYESSVKKGGSNLVLFRGPDISTEHIETDGEYWLLYRGKSSYIADEIIIKTVKNISNSHCI